MKLISWNVNGIRAAAKKGFYDFFDTIDADIFAIQETKLQEGQFNLELPESYYQYWSHAQRKGYSGTAVFTKTEPLQVVREVGSSHLDDEGRLCALEFDDFWFVNVYTPNSQDGLARLSHRMEFDDAFRDLLCEMAMQKNVIACGDLNVAHSEIDLKNPGPNRGNAGFSDEERAKLTELLNAGFVDSFRYLYPDLTGAYSWWSYRFNARANNAGWRLDYFLVSNPLEEKIEEASILTDVTGSDHCPVGLLLAR